ncbi:hypothetical protein ACIPW9_13270 [Streptomyces sp. NPDC090052]|uniref:hypothetical protein n=1 Tax=Streptomyces sp. NPDC090052 TaxID=3365931 RepID=UPI00381365C5
MSTTTPGPRRYKYRGEPSGGDRPDAGSGRPAGAAPAQRAVLIGVFGDDPAHPHSGAAGGHAARADPGVFEGSPRGRVLFGAQRTLSRIHDLSPGYAVDPR